jgi:hypothetical protein
VLIPAPAPGVAVTMTPRNPACVAATSPVTIPARRGSWLPLPTSSRIR